MIRALAYVLVLGLLVGSFAYITLVFARKVTGTSMYPTLEEGDMVVVVSEPFSSIKAGDIIVYNPHCSTTGNSVIHRVIGIVPEGLVTKGDNNFATDQQGGIAAGAVTANCVEGKVVFVVPYLEKLSFLPYDANYFLAAAILLLLVASEIYSSRRDRGAAAEASA